MTEEFFPENLRNLHSGEEELRKKAMEIIKSNERFKLHLFAIERAMDMADVLRKFPTEDEDTKAIQVLGMRLFNAFAASTKLLLSGYLQNSAFILRDVLETVFLLDHFRTSRDAISRWRLADKKERMKLFSPIQVRKALDERDGHTEQKRAKLYELFSELAGHPNMKSIYMMRPKKEGIAVIGPFIESSSFEAVISEMGRLAVQVGEILDAFFPIDWELGIKTRVNFAKIKITWMKEFYPQHTSSVNTTSSA